MSHIPCTKLLIILNNIFLPLDSDNETESNDGIDFDGFCDIMVKCNFETLANHQVFSVFDADGNGRIDVQEFLLALVSLRSKYGGNDDVDELTLYFNMFDLNGDGQICKVELGLVMDCLLYDGSGHDSLYEKKKNIDDVFRAFDKDNSGSINYAEFVELYNFIKTKCEDEQSL